MTIALGAVFLLVVVVAVLVTLNARPETPINDHRSDDSFLDNFSLHSYRPMLRLAAETDRSFLHAIHGEPFAAAYRKVQREILRGYLRDASKDFSRLYSIASAHAVEAVSDPGDLSMAVLEQHMTFILLIWSIETRMLLDRILPLGVDLNPVVASLEGLAKQTQERARDQFAFHATA